MGQSGFSEVIDWLSDREGQRVFMEVGLPDPALDGTDIIVVAQHVTLGKPQIGENIDHEGRGMTYVPFEGDERNRFYIDPKHVTDIRVAQGAVKVVFHDSTYIGFSGYER